VKISHGYIKKQPEHKGNFSGGVMEALTRAEGKLIALFFIAATFIGAVLTTVFALTHHIIEVFPFLYIVCIVLLVFFYQQTGLYFAIVTSCIYPALSTVYGLLYGGQPITSLSWFVVFLAVACATYIITTENRTGIRRYRTIFDHLPGGVFTFDPASGLIRDVNPAFALLLDYPENALVDQSLSRVMPNPGLRDRFVQECQTPGNCEIGGVFVTRDGISHEFRVAVAVSPDNRVICSVPVIQAAISGPVPVPDHATSEAGEQVQAQELTYANKELQHEIQERQRFEVAVQRANRKLNTVFDITRHDVLNQITAISMYLSLVQELVTDTTVAEYLKKIEQVTRMIQKQINFTRDYQNIGVKSPQWQNVGLTIAAAASGVNPGKVTLEQDTGDLEIFCDLLLERVFFSILDNAIQHGQTVSMIRVFLDEVSDGVTITIEDDGVGIPLDKKTKIFNREYYRNTGYGLFLAVEILSITGLTIRETGEPGKGARFEIHAPHGSFRHAKPGGGA
jgi:signal transduction histidine kinase